MCKNNRHKNTKNISNKNITYSIGKHFLSKSIIELINLHKCNVLKLLLNIYVKG